MSVPIIWMYSVEVPAPEGLDTAKYLVTIGVERRDDEPLSAADLLEIKKAVAPKDE